MVAELPQFGRFGKTVWKKSEFISGAYAWCRTLESMIEYDQKREGRPWKARNGVYELTGIAGVQASPKFETLEQFQSRFIATRKECEKLETIEKSRRLEPALAEFDNVFRSLIEAFAVIHEASDWVGHVDTANILICIDPHSGQSRVILPDAGFVVKQSVKPSQILKNEISPKLMDQSAEAMNRERRTQVGKHAKLTSEVIRAELRCLGRCLAWMLDASDAQGPRYRAVAQHLGIANSPKTFGTDPSRPAELALAGVFGPDPAISSAGELVDAFSKTPPSHLLDDLEINSTVTRPGRKGSWKIWIWIVAGSLLFGAFVYGTGKWPGGVKYHQLCPNCPVTAEMAGLLDRVQAMDGTVGGTTPALNQSDYLLEGPVFRALDEKLELLQQLDIEVEQSGTRQQLRDGRRSCLQKCCQDFEDQVTRSLRNLFEVDYQQPMGAIELKTRLARFNVYHDFLKIHLTPEGDRKWFVEELQPQLQLLP